MAKVKVAADLIVDAMFEGGMVTIMGCSFDPFQQTVTFDIQGGDVPDVDEVVAEVTVARRTVTFKPRETAPAA